MLAHPLGFIEVVAGNSTKIFALHGWSSAAGFADQIKCLSSLSLKIKSSSELGLWSCGLPSGSGVCAAEKWEDPSLLLEPSGHSTSWAVLANPEGIFPVIQMVPSPSLQVDANINKCRSASQRPWTGAIFWRYRTQ